MKKPVHNMTYQLVISGLMVALGIVMSSLFHSISLSGSVFLPMHIPVLLCGLICGWQFGFASGVLIPLLCSILLGMPPLYPVGAAMACELAAYGFFSGLLMKKTNHIFLSLVSAMLIGRIILGLVNLVLLGIAGNGYSVTTFVSAAFLTALPGIVIQLILIPVLMAAFKKSHLLEKAA